MKERQPAWWIVATREMVVRLTDRTFIISTVIMLVLLAGGATAGVLLGGRGSVQQLVASTPQAQALAEQIAAGPQSAGSQDRVEVLSAPDDAAARAMVMDGRADAYLHQVDGVWTLSFKGTPSATLQARAAQVVSLTATAGLAQQAGVPVEQAIRSGTLSVEVMQTDTSQSMLGYFVGLALGVLFLTVMMTFGPQISTSIAQEKQSRVVEILVAAIPAASLLTGKVVANTILALGQTVLYAVIGLIGLRFSALSQYLPAVGGAAVGYVLLFLAGFLVMACLWAAAGAMVSRVEDVGSTSGPLTWVIVLAYMAGFMVQGRWQVILSYVPVFSTVLMPTRLAMGTAQWWEVAIALVLDVLFAAAAVLVGSRIFRNGLLQMRGKLSLRQALSLG